MKEFLWNWLNWSLGVAIAVFWAIIMAGIIYKIVDTLMHWQILYLAGFLLLGSIWLALMFALREV